MIRKQTDRAPRQLVGSIMATVHYTLTYSQDMSNIPFQVREARRAALFKKRPADEEVNMAVFGDRAEEVREAIRKQVEAREGPASGL